MFTWLCRWRPIHLLGAWCAYWIALVVVGLWPALIAHIGIVPRPGAHETISASLHDGFLSASLGYAGSVLWSASIHLVVLALWVAGPPLALCLLWAAARRRDITAPSAART